MIDETEQYLNQLYSRGRTEVTIRLYRQMLEYLMIFLQKRRVRAWRDVTIQDLRRYQSDLKKRKLKTESQRTFLGPVRLFLQWAYRHDLILADLASRMILPAREEVLPPKPLSREEVATMLSLPSSVTVTGLRNRAILELMYGCGLRRGEVTGLRMKDLDCSAETLLVHGKGQKDRVLPVNDAAIRAVRAYLEKRGGASKERDALFMTHGTNTPRPINGAIVSNVFRRLSKKMARHVYPHLLRHTFAVHLLMGGISLRHLQVLLGHESLDTTARYLGLVKDEIRAAYDAAMEWINAGRES